MLLRVSWAGTGSQPEVPADRINTLKTVSFLFSLSERQASLASCQLGDAPHCLKMVALLPGSYREELMLEGPGRRPLPHYQEIGVDNRGLLRVLYKNTDPLVGLEERWKYVLVGIFLPHRKAF